MKLKFSYIWIIEKKNKDREWEKYDRSYSLTKKKAEEQIKWFKKWDKGTYRAKGYTRT